MTNSHTLLSNELLRLSKRISESLSRINDESSQISVKSILETLIPDRNPSEGKLRNSITDFTLACALLSASESSTHELLTWIPRSLSVEANAAVRELSDAYGECFPEEKGLVVEVMGEAVLLLKGRIKESSIDGSVDGADEVSAACARVPVGYAVVAAYQFRWFVTQVGFPHLGKLCALVIPCALTCLDHWSPEVKAQGMISFTHIARNVNADELGLYEEVILDASCQNIASSDEIWPLVVEMSVLLLTCTQRSNPRSPWYEKILGEMLSHLERQPGNKERCIAWLEFIEPLLDGLGLVLLAHFKRIFPLFFKWMHADDDETILLVLQRIYTVMRLTWIRNTPYVERLVDELAVLYKDAAQKTSRESIRTHIVRILTLLQQCKGTQFEEAWNKHRTDPNLTTLSSSLAKDMQERSSNDHVQGSGSSGSLEDYPHKVDVCS